MKDRRDAATDLFAQILDQEFLHPLWLNPSPAFNRWVADHSNPFFKTEELVSISKREGITLTEREAAYIEFFKKLRNGCLAIFSLANYLSEDTLAAGFPSFTDTALGEVQLQDGKMHFLTAKFNDGLPVLERELLEQRYRDACGSDNKLAVLKNIVEEIKITYHRSERFLTNISKLKTIDLKSMIACDRDEMEDIFYNAVHEWYEPREEMFLVPGVLKQQVEELCSAGFDLSKAINFLRALRHHQLVIVGLLIEFSRNNNMHTQQALAEYLAKRMADVVPGLLDTVKLFAQLDRLKLFVGQTKILKSKIYTSNDRMARSLQLARAKLQGAVHAEMFLDSSSNLPLFSVKLPQYFEKSDFEDALLEASSDPDAADQKLKYFWQDMIIVVMNVLKFLSEADVGALKNTPESKAILEWATKHSILKFEKVDRYHHKTTDKIVLSSLESFNDKRLLLKHINLGKMWAQIEDTFIDTPLKVRMVVMALIKSYERILEVFVNEIIKLAALDPQKTAANRYHSRQMLSDCLQHSKASSIFDISKILLGYSASSFNASHATINTSANLANQYFFSKVNYFFINLIEMLNVPQSYGLTDVILELGENYQEYFHAAEFEKIRLSEWIILFRSYSDTNQAMPVKKRDLLNFLQDLEDCMEFTVKPDGLIEAENIRYAEAINNLPQVRQQLGAVPAVRAARANSVQASDEILAQMSVEWSDLLGKNIEQAWDMLQFNLLLMRTSDKELLKKGQPARAEGWLLETRKELEAIEERQLILRKPDASTLSDRSKLTVRLSNFKKQLENIKIAAKLEILTDSFNRLVSSMPAKALLPSKSKSKKSQPAPPKPTLASLIIELPLSPENKTPEPSPAAASPAPAAPKAKADSPVARTAVTTRLVDPIDPLVLEKVEFKRLHKKSEENFKDVRHTSAVVLKNYRSLEKMQAYPLISERISTLNAEIETAQKSLTLLVEYSKENFATLGTVIASLDKFEKVQLELQKDIKLKLTQCEAEAAKKVEEKAKRKKQLAKEAEEDQKQKDKEKKVKPATERAPRAFPGTPKPLTITPPVAKAPVLSTMSAAAPTPEQMRLKASRQLHLDAAYKNMVYLYAIQNDSESEANLAVNHFARLYIILRTYQALTIHHNIVHQLNELDDVTLARLTTMLTQHVSGDEVVAVNEFAASLVKPLPEEFHTIVKISQQDLTREQRSSLGLALGVLDANVASRALLQDPIPVIETTDIYRKLTEFVSREPKPVPENHLLPIVHHCKTELEYILQRIGVKGEFTLPELQAIRMLMTICGWLSPFIKVLDENLQQFLTRCREVKETVLGLECYINENVEAAKIFVISLEDLVYPIKELAFQPVQPRAHFINQICKNIFYLNNLAVANAPGVLPIVKHYASLFNIFSCFQAMQMYERVVNHKEFPPHERGLNCLQVIINQHLHNTPENREAVTKFVMKTRRSLKKSAAFEDNFCNHLFTNLEQAQILRSYNLLAGMAVVNDESYIPTIVKSDWYEALAQFQLAGKTENVTPRKISQLASCISALKKLTEFIALTLADIEIAEDYLDCAVLEIQAINMLVMICGELGRRLTRTGDNNLQEFLKNCSTTLNDRLSQHAYVAEDMEIARASILKLHQQLAGIKVQDLFKENAGQLPFFNKDNKLNKRQERKPAEEKHYAPRRPGAHASSSSTD